MYSESNCKWNNEIEQKGKFSIRTLMKKSSDFEGFFAYDSKCLDFSLLLILYNNSFYEKKILLFIQINWNINA